MFLKISLYAALLPVLFIYTKPPSHVIKGNKPLICGQNEEPTDCVEPCLPTCDIPKRPFCTYRTCPGGCVCAEGYIRETMRGKCVPVSSCVNSADITRNYSAPCDENAIPSYCETPCEPTCSNPEPSNCTSLWCAHGCVCKEGYVRKKEGGFCVLKENCE
ncbi:unnamed protein product [Tenebrio molitor]|jgi:hypothetical protein|nr:unnamed protein product [Tenebrio molitor]